MEAWASVAVAIVAGITGVVGTFVRRSRAKSQLDALSRLREEIAATPPDASDVGRQLRAAELHLAKRIEFRYRRTPRGLTLVFWTGLSAGLWSASWLVVTFVSALSDPPKYVADGTLASLTSVYTIGGFVVLLIMGFIAKALQDRSDKAVLAEATGDAQTPPTPDPDSVLETATASQVPFIQAQE